MTAPREIIGRIIERSRRFEAETIGGDVHFKPTHRTPGKPMTTINVRLDDGREAYGKYSDPSRVRLFLRAKRQRGRNGRHAAAKVSPSWFD